MSESESGFQAEEETINRQRQLEQEQRMAKEIARIDHERQTEERMKRLIIENRLHFLLQGTTEYFGSLFLILQCLMLSLLIFSEELRQLKSKLSSAYVNKERAAQIAEKEAMRYQTMVRTAFIDTVFMRVCSKVYCLSTLTTIY